ncbi:MAG: LptF/LptG family permease [Clostridia bacterium]|nr:LptF/LptG family permease [Deltaproteobacteria bacterium]
MRLMRYIGLLYAGAIMLTIIGLVVIVVGASLVEGSGMFMRANAGAGTVIAIAGYRALGFAYQIVPAAILLGAMIAGTTLARRGELLAMQAAGIGPTRVWGAFLIVAISFALVTAFAGELVVPWSIVQIEMENRESLGRTDTATSFYTRQVQWFRRNDLVLYLPENLRNDRFGHPVVYRIVGGVLQTVLEADYLASDNATGFHLANARVLDVATSTFSHVPSYPLKLDATVSALADITGDPRRMRLSEIAKLAERRTLAGFDATPHTVELHGRLSHPLNAVALMLVSAPWALHIDRKRSLAVNLGGGVVAIAVTLTLMYTFRMLALGHQLPSVLGAWGLTLSILVVVPLSAFVHRKLRVA